MVTLQDSLLSSSARKLPIRKRPDLTARRQHYLGRTYWVVKEPVGLNYYRFQEEEFAILNMLDGETSLDEIKDRFEAEFPPQKITLEELQQFLGMLHRSGLVIASVPGQGRQLCKRRAERKRKELLGAAANILCIRFKGFDPERILNWLYPYLRWVYSPVTVGLCLLLAVSALILVSVQFDVFRSKLPDFYQFFNFYNGLWLMIVLGITKIVHEFGHGLTCKHFGGECHEMGVMILVLTPCLYCNVSDSWMLPNKWHRAAIGAAGIYIEMVLASICTFLWWFTEPGLLNHLCLNTMFICSISTVIFNANPLLRYDGYYILADLTEIPNLRQKATAILSRKSAHWFLGIEPPEDPFLPQRNQVFFVLYSVAAAFYRWFVLASILWFLYQVFKPYGLEVIGNAIVLASLVGLVGVPGYKVGKFFYVPGRLDKVKKPRMYTSLGVLAALLLAVVFVPLPHRVICSLEVQARDADYVYIAVPGQLDELRVQQGDRVTKGQQLAQLTSIDLNLEIAKLTGEVDQYKKQLENLRRQRFRDPRVSSQIPAVTEALNAAEEQLKKKQQDHERLRLTAPADGMVLPPPEIPEEKSQALEGQLGRWFGTPLQTKNVGAHLEASTLFCQVGDPRRLEAILVIDQADIPYVREGQTVDMKLDELPHDTLSGYISEVAKIDLKIAPRSLSTTKGGELATKTDPKSGVETPQSTSYQARVPIDDDAGLLRLGLRGRGKIYANWLPLGTRLWRFFSHTFHFRL